MRKFTENIRLELSQKTWESEGTNFFTIMIREEIWKTIQQTQVAILAAIGILLNITSSMLVARFRGARHGGLTPLPSAFLRL